MWNYLYNHTDSTLLQSLLNFNKTIFKGLVRGSAIQIWSLAHQCPCTERDSRWDHTSSLSRLFQVYKQKTWHWAFWRVEKSHTNMSRDGLLRAVCVCRCVKACLWDCTLHGQVSRCYGRGSVTRAVGGPPWPLLWSPTRRSRPECSDGDCKWSGAGRSLTPGEYIWMRSVRVWSWCDHGELKLWLIIMFIQHHNVTSCELHLCIINYMLLFACFICFADACSSIKFSQVFMQYLLDGIGVIDW